MEEQPNQVTPVENPVASGNSAVSSRSPKIAFIIFAVLGIAVLGILIAVFSSKKSSQPIPAQKPIGKSVSSVSPKSALPTPSSTKNWLTYTIKTVRIQFKLPPNIAKLGNLKEDVIKSPTISGPSLMQGSVLCLRFTNDNVTPSGSPEIGCVHHATDVFTIGGSSPDYKVARDLMFTELQGYQVINEKYFAKLNLDRLEDIPQDLVEKEGGPSRIGVIKVNGKTDNNIPLLGSLISGDIGGIINTHLDSFPGIAIQANTKVINENTFKQILMSFDFIEK